MPPKKENKPAPAKESHLLVMTREGDEPIRVHPDQVGPWQAQGWKVEEK